MGLRICHISTVHRANDVRIYYKECQSLAAVGFDVHWVAPGPKPELSAVIFHAITRPSSRLSRFIIGGWQAFFKVRSIKPDVVHLHDPELLILGLVLNSIGYKVIFDMHELVSKQIADKSYLKSGAKLAARLYARVERWSVVRFEAVVLAEQGYLAPMQRLYAEHIAKFHVIQNFPDIDRIRRIEVSTSLAEGFNIIYVGGLTAIRGARDMCRAIGEIDDAHLWLVGPWENDELRTECLGHSWSDRIHETGWLPWEEVIALVKAGDLGLCMLDPVENYRTSLPVKVFEYLSCSIPVLASDFQLWKQTFTSGVAFCTPGDSNELAKAIGALKHNPEELENLRSGGSELVNNRFNWQNEALKLVQIYKNIELKS
jgi:glycosyltransferase involved in cell wall biosynthesis